MRFRWHSRLSLCSIVIAIHVWIGLWLFHRPKLVSLTKMYIGRWKFPRDHGSSADSVQNPWCQHFLSGSRGLNQRVITISMFGPKENSLFQSDTSLAFLHDFIRDASEIYPGWIVRIYHDHSVDTKQLNMLQCQYDFIDLYDMAGKTHPPPRMWRFTSIGDTSVDIMLSRDLDSPLTHRERSAVDEWLISNKILHIMRDHPLHNDRIMAGMWGFRSARNRDIAHLINMKLQNASLMEQYRGGGDQLFLLNELWPLIDNDSIAHDSFHCERLPNHTKPFPTRRPSILGRNIFVGCVKPCSDNQFVFDSCPVACRPPNHKDWTLC